VFLTQLIRHAGHDIDFSEMDGDLLMIATIQAAGGVTQPLEELFTESIRE
jgi:cell filamentation protein